MRLSFFFEKVESTGDLKSKIAKKISSIEKYIQQLGPAMKEGVVKLAKGERWGYKVKVDLKVPGKNLIVEAKNRELLSAVDKVVAKLRHMIDKNRKNRRAKA